MRAPAWAPGFEATIGGVTHTPSNGRLIEIERLWSQGDKVRVKIPLDIRQVPDGDKTTDAVALVRGPQVLATDTAIEADGGIPESWWGDTLYTRVVKQGGVEMEYRLVTFADAGQNKEEYAVLHENIEANASV
ncbi:MAG: glycoside hydrolase family 127 protein [Pseudomonadales bacterium]|nr:glycoside hydrolase family 127 protein [Pseudomonadales bacterium]